MGKADLHIHTAYSLDSCNTISAVLEQAAFHRHLDVIAITDHNSVAGVHEAQDMAGKYGIEVIPGCEITTSEGHLVALFIDKPIPTRRPLAETVLRVGEQGGVCIAAHPMAIGVNSISEPSLRNALQTPGVSEILVGIEAFNAGIIYPSTNEKSKKLGVELGLSLVGSSDSHLLSTIGRGMTLFKGKTARELRQALENHTTHHVQVAFQKTVKYYLDHVMTELFLRPFGWLLWNPNPGEGFVWRWMPNTPGSHW
ncbi:MAG: PHP domain-containing protein [Anaerolineae bacterium]|nr:PHP domain-containing protein [Anaerolineae bacterium]